MRLSWSAIVAVALLGAGAAAAQYVEGYLRLDDEYSGANSAACVAYDSVANAVYVSGWRATIVFDAATGRKLARMPQYGDWVAAAPADGKMYVLGRSLYSFDASTHQLIGTVEVRSRTWEITPPAAVSSTLHKLYHCTEYSVIGVVDTRTDSLLRTIALPGTISGLCYAQNLEKLYVTGWREITVIDCISDSIIAVLPVWTDRYWVQAYSPVSEKLYHGGDYLTVIDCRADTVLRREPLPYFVAFMAYDPLSNRVYCDYGERAVLTIDCASDSVVRVVETRTAETWYASFLNSSAGKFYYDAGCNRATIWVYDCAADSQVAVLHGALQGFGPPYPNLCLNPRDNIVYMANYECGMVTVIDGAGDSLLRTVVVGDNFGLDELWCDWTTGRVYGLAEHLGALSVIDGATNTLVATKWVGALPNRVAYNPVARKAYIYDEEVHELAVVSAPDDTVTAGISSGCWPPFAVSEDGSRLFAGRGSGCPEVSVVDCAADTVIGTIALGQQPNLLATSSRLNRLCAVCGRTFFVIDLDSSLRSRAIPLTYDVAALGYSPAQERWYCFGRSGIDSVTVIDGRDASVRVRVSVPGVYRSEALGRPLHNPRTDRLYYRTSGESCAVFDCRADSVVAVVPLRQARLCDTIRNRVYGVDQDGVVVLDGATDSVLVRLPVAEPGRMAWYPYFGRVFVGSGSSTVVVIRDTATGIGEGGVHPASSARATVVRGVLHLRPSPFPLPEGEGREDGAALLGATGRKVLDLAPGPNDVRHLAPGVYFVRAVGREPSVASCQKVVLTR